MQGEVVVKVDNIKISGTVDFITPYRDVISENKSYMDMDLHMPDGTLHLVGENDWGYLMASALVPLLRYADSVQRELDKMYQESEVRADAIVLGKNEYRALDIMNLLKHPGTTLKEYKGIPIVQSQIYSYMKIYGEPKEQLPF